jgi:hypothetical protein
MATEHEQLVTFLDETLALLASVVNQRVALIRNDFRVPLQHAWREFDEGFDRIEARALIRAIPRRRLEEFGLFGHQLALKLSVISTLMEIFGRP